MKGPPEAAMHRRDEGRRHSSINTNDHTRDEVGVRTPEGHHACANKIDVTLATGGFDVSAEVTNSGSLAGRAVVEGYLSAPAGSNLPTNALATFSPTTLDARASTTLTMFLPDSSMAQWNNNAMRVLAGTYTLNVGQSSDGDFLITTLNIPTTFAPN
jgi:hypothetical protein